MAMIPEETIEEIRELTDIAELIGQHVKLRRSGGGYIGLCPFHNEKTPSFNVTPSRKSFKCFGCGIGGDVFKFLKEYENLPFPEAVRRLADRAGIRIVEADRDPEADRLRKIRGQLVKINGAAAAWFHKLLLEDPSAGEARAYLRGRGLSGQTVRDWEIGFAPGGDVAIANWAAEQGYTPQLLTDAGLMSPRDENNLGRGYYPRFRDRVMFPLRTEFGDTIAFSGRLLDPNAKAAKYVNSPETRIFNKSKVIYGFDKTRRPVLDKKSAIICEGQLDLITCFESGIQNVVAPLGTAFTEFHAQTLRRHADEVILCFDADAAGYKAAGKAFATLATAGLHVRAADMPLGEDPDTLIRSQGAEVFAEIIAKAPDFYDFQIDHLAAELDFGNIRHRVRFAEEVAPNIALLPDKVTQDAAIHKVSVRLEMPPDEFRKLVIDAGSEAKRLASRPARAPRGAAGGAPPAPVANFRIGNRAIAGLCRLALADLEAKTWLSEPVQWQILVDTPDAAPLREIVDASFDPNDEGQRSNFLAGLPAQQGAYFEKLLTFPYPFSGVADARGILLKLEVERLQGIIKPLRAKLREPGIDDETRSDLQEHYMELTKEFLDLEKQRTDSHHR